MSKERTETAEREISKPNVCHLRIWHSEISTDRQGEFESKCERLLASEELETADRFRLITSRNQHVVGRAMARQLLSQYGASPDSIRFVAGRHGKPSVDQPAALRLPFNIAHTNGLVMCGIADEHAGDVGIDVEATSRKTSTELAERYFSRPEVEFLRSQPVADQRYFFLRIWTLKESFIKAIGTGLYTPLGDFTFDNIESRSPRIRFLNPKLDDGRQWRFICFHPRDGYVASAAICAKQIDSDVSIDWLAFEDLME